MKSSDDICHVGWNQEPDTAGPGTGEGAGAGEGAESGAESSPHGFRGHDRLWMRRGLQQ